MAVDLETLEIKIEASASNATKSLDNLASSLKNVKSALSNLNGKEKHVEKVGEKAAEAEQKVSEAAKETKDLNEQQNKAADSGKKFSFSLANITKSAGKVQSGISSIFSGFKNGDVASIFSGISSFKSAFEGATSSGKGVGETAAEGAKKAAEEMKDAGDAAGAAGDAASASAGGWEAVAAVLIMDVAKGAIKVWWAFQKLKFNVVAAPFKWMAEHATNAIAKVTQLFAALKRIAMYRLLRTVIKEIGEGFSTGLENAYYFSQVTGGSLAKSLDLIATEFLYLKNSIGAAVAPLINALAPAVEFVVDKFVSLLNVVNQFLSALGIGGKWIKAIKYPTKYGDALDDATGSAKELKRTILGIDEINPLNGDNGSGKGKSGFTAADYSQMFEYETIDPQIADFAAQIKAMIERGAWGELGSLLGGKINKFLQDADALVNWDGGAGEKIKEKLGNITEAINGFLNTFNGEYLGQLVGDAIQTFFNSISFFDENLDSTALADDISGFINGALQRLDGQKIGETIHNVVTTTIGVLRNAIKGVDSGLLAEDAAGFISGLNITDIISRANSLFGDLGKAIEPAVEAMISSIWDDAKGFIAQKFSEAGAFIEYKVKSAWNDFINDLIEMAQQSPLTSWLVPSLQKGLVDLGDTAIGAAANTASDIYEFVGGVFSGFNSVFMKGGEENADAYESGLNSKTEVGKTFADTVSKNVDGDGNGKKDAGLYRGSYFGTLSIGPRGTEITDGQSFLSKIATALGFNKGGQDDAGTYKGGFFAKLGSALTGGETTTGNGLFTKIANTLGFKTGGESTSGTYRSGFFSKLGSAAVSDTDKTNGNGFFTKIANTLGFKSGGENTSGTYRSGFFSKLGSADINATDKGNGNGFFTKIANTLGFKSGGEGTSGTYRSGFFSKLGSAAVSDTDKGNGNGFFTKIANTLGFKSGGEGTSGTYRSGFFSKLGSADINATDKGNGNGLFTKIANTLGFKSGGESTSGTYRSGFFSKLGSTAVSDTDKTNGNGFFAKIANALGFSSAGGTDAGTYKSGFSNDLAQPLSATISENVKKFGHKVSGAVLSSKGGADGATDAASYRNALNNSFSGAVSPAGVKTFGGKVSTSMSAGANPSGTATGIANTLGTTLNNSDGVGGTFGGKVKSKIYDGINVTQLAKDTRTGLNTEFEKNTTVGENLGKKLGKNIASGIATGLNGKKITVETYSAQSGKLISSDTTKIGAYLAATGGVFDSGQMIIANEAGPELVGNIGRKTAVANTTQMVDAMAQGVYQANAEGNMLMRQLIQYAAEIAAKEYSTGGEVTVESITNAMARNNRRLGKTTVGVY